MTKEQKDLVRLYTITITCVSSVVYLLTMIDIDMSVLLLVNIAISGYMFSFLKYDV